MRRLIVLLLAAFFLLEGAAHAQFSIHVIDVGQADAILLEFRHSAILIDAGGESTYDNHYGEHFLSELNAFFAKRDDLGRTFQAVILTHPHIDHTRLLMDVVEGNDFKVKYLYDGGEEKGSGARQLKEARKYASSHAIKYVAIRDKAIGKEGFTPSGLSEISSDADVRFLAGSRDCANGNNNSLVIRVRSDDKTALFTGDSETDDDDECEDGQIENLLERYEGTHLLRADVYKVGHHGSHNGTDQALLSAVSPMIAIISAGHKETKGPGIFHGFFFGHPREDVVEMLESTTRDRNPPVSGYTYLKGTKKQDATDTIIEGRLIAKAVYCTCWDGDLTIDSDESSGKFAVTASAHLPIDHGDRPKPIRLMTSDPLSSRTRIRSGALVTNEEPDRSSWQHTLPILVIFIFFLSIIYFFMRRHENRQERWRRTIASALIKRLKGTGEEEGWKFSPFELGAFIQRNPSDELSQQSFLPKPRLSTDEIIEQAVAELISADKWNSPAAGMNDHQRKAMIEELKQLHSDPESPAVQIGPLPSIMFLKGAVPTIILLVALQAVPSVENYLVGILGPDSLLQEVWAGLLAMIVGTSATLLRKKSGFGSDKAVPKSNRETR